MKKIEKVERKPDPELREFMKLMEVEDLRDQARRLEERNIDHDRKMRMQAQAEWAGRKPHGQ